MNHRSIKQYTYKNEYKIKQTGNIQFLLKFESQSFAIPIDPLNCPAHRIHRRSARRIRPRSKPSSSAMSVFRVSKINRISSDSVVEQQSGQAYERPLLMHQKVRTKRRTTPARLGAAPGKFLFPLQGPSTPGPRVEGVNALAAVLGVIPLQIIPDPVHSHGRRGTRKIECSLVSSASLGNEWEN